MDLQRFKIFNINLRGKQMVNKYQKAIQENITEVLSKITDIKTNVYDVKQLENILDHSTKNTNDLHSTKNIEYPFAVVSFNTEYTAKNNSYRVILDNSIETKKDIDFVNSIPGVIKTEVTIYANDIKELITLEELIISSYRIEHILYAKNLEKENQNIIFSLKLDDSSKIKRDSTINDFFNEQSYYSIITLYSEGCVFFTKKYHPAEIELDSNIQLEILKQTVVISEYLVIMEEELKSLRPDWYTVTEIDSEPNFFYNEFEIKRNNDNCKRTESYVPSEREILLENRINELKNQLDSNLSSLSPKIEEMRFLLALKKYSYLKEYVLEMTNKNCSIDEAIESFEKRRYEYDKKIAEENDKLSDNEKETTDKYNFILETKGDDEINRYTDAVVNDFKNKFKDYESLKIYGGSTYMQWHKKLNNNELEFPNILLESDSNFAINQKSYLNINENNKSISHIFNINALPIFYSVLVKIFAKSKEEIDTIEEQLKNYYTHENFLYIQDPCIQNEWNCIKLSIDNSIEPYDTESYHIEYDNDNNRNVYVDYYQRNIKFNRPINVYYVKKYGRNRVENDQQLQYRLVQQLEYLMLCHESLLGDALKQLDTEYKELITKKTLLGATFDGFFRSSEYKELKMCFQLGKTIDRKLFDSVLNKITTYYPYLYDRLMQGWSIEQIHADIEKIAEKYNNRAIELFNLLEIPKYVYTKIDSKYSAREVNAISFYINEMCGNIYTTIDKAIEKYKEKLMDTEREKEEKMQKRIEMQQSRRTEVYQPQYSSNQNNYGSSVNTLDIVAGVAIGNEISNRREERRALKKGKDFLGTAGCQYGKKDEHGWTQHCDFTCPLYNNCLRGGGR